MRFKQPFIQTINTLILTLLMVYASTLYAAEKAPFSEQADVQAFIQQMVKKHQFDEKELQTLFQQAEFKQNIIDAMQRPAEGKPWYQYRKIFLNDKRIRLGDSFWRTHEETLAKAEREYGVPAPIIVAILGVETYYGENQGNFRVIDALSTIAFGYPKRSSYFKKELEQFLLMARENHFDPLSIKGSYAGAIGQPQFMPSSYRRYAVDYTGNHQKDLQHATDDVIGSVANYFKKHGWQTQQPIALQASVATLEVPHEKLHKPKISLAKWQQQQVTPKQSATQTLNPNEKALLLAFEQENNQKEYWLAFNNFYTITRYNTSPMYALAVVQLSEEIAKRHAETT